MPCWLPLLGWKRRRRESKGLTRNFISRPRRCAWRRTERWLPPRTFEVHLRVADDLPGGRNWCLVSRDKSRAEADEERLLHRMPRQKRRAMVAAKHRRLI